MGGDNMSRKIDVANLVAYYKGEFLEIVAIHPLTQLVTLENEERRIDVTTGEVDFYLLDELHDLGQDDHRHNCPACWGDPYAKHNHETLEDLYPKRPTGFEGRGLY
jgi:hypothetical protein